MILIMRKWKCLSIKWGVFLPSILIQYIEYPRTWQEVVEERFLIRQDSLKLLPRKEEPSRISLFVLPHSIFVRKDH